ncbi:MAG: rod shape-determining protein MreD [Bacteroidales bacterium]|jgi:rod shape-determining protein MreD|nr:rod shape-determining protein MreD [Bacteroidales bacterium]
MINTLLKFGSAFLLLILAQVLVFNNIQFSGFINPYVYVLFILLLPLAVPGWLLLLLAFITGMTMDFFVNSPGMHTAATVLAGYVRPYILRILSPRDGYESGPNPSISAYGFRWFFTYTAVIIFIHHIALFYLEVFRLADFFRTFLRVILSSAFSVMFILIIEYYRKRR